MVRGTLVSQVDMKQQPRFCLILSWGSENSKNVAHNRGGGGALWANTRPPAIRDGSAGASAYDDTNQMALVSAILHLSRSHVMLRTCTAWYAARPDSPASSLMTSPSCSHVPSKNVKRETKLTNQNRRTR